MTNIPPGLSVSVSLPVIRGGEFLFSIARPDSLTFSKERIGGFMACSLTVAVSEIDMNWWFEDGLGRDIRIVGPTGVTCWEGFVDSITISLAGLRYQRGPLTALANRVLVLYSPIATDGSVGARTETLYANDAASQRDYGIWEKIISAGTCKPAEAVAVRDMYLVENSAPELSQDINLFGTTTPTVTIDCLGYFYFLAAYTYKHECAEGETDSKTISSAITDVLAYSPNNIFNIEGAGDIETNGLLISGCENDYTEALALIQGLVGLGSPAYQTCAFGVYANRRVIYRFVTEDIAYLQGIRSNESNLLDAGSQGVVYPWDVLPGRWARLYDALPGRWGGTPLRKDPQCALIERTEFTAPFELRWGGGKRGTFAQRLAQLAAGL